MSNAVAGAGLCLLVTRVQRFGLQELFDDTVDFGAAAGHANVGLKAMGLTASALARGDSIDGTDALRSGRSMTGLWLLGPTAGPERWRKLFHVGAGLIALSAVDREAE